MYVKLQITEHVSSHGKSLCKNMTRASGGCKQNAPPKMGEAQTEKITNVLVGTKTINRKTVDR